MYYGVVVQRIGHIPSKDTMMVRFHPALPIDFVNPAPYERGILIEFFNKIRVAKISMSGIMELANN